MVAGFHVRGAHAALCVCVGAWVLLGVSSPLAPRVSASGLYACSLAERANERVRVCNVLWARLCGTSHACGVYGLRIACCHALE